MLQMKIVTVMAMKLIRNVLKMVHNKLLMYGL